MFPRTGEVIVFVGVVFGSGGIGLIVRGLGFTFRVRVRAIDVGFKGSERRFGDYVCVVVGEDVVDCGVVVFVGIGVFD